MERSLDLVLLGATGFTGALTAEYMARHAPAGTRWGLAGRNTAKLEAVRERLARIHERHSQIELVRADVTDPGSLRDMAESARVVITTVGPYAQHGEPVVAACAAAGTDYVDLTGEPEFVDRMYLLHHERARGAGGRIIHCCGFDSIPADLGALYTVEQLPEGVPLRIEGYVSAGGGFSGGTFHSAVNAFANLREYAQVSRQRRAREPRPAGRRIGSASEGLLPKRAFGGWALPFPTIDPQIVRRSARALDRYGPSFSYAHYAQVKRLPVAAGLAGGAAGLVALSQLPPTRKLLLSLKSAGEGPSPEQREKAWFRLRFVGEGGGDRVVCEVSGGDPGYGETAKMLSESALCLAHDDLPRTAGQVTPAAAMGEALTARLQRAGIQFKVVEGS